MDPWVLWLIAAVILAIGEMATMGLFLAPFAGGALVAALARRGRRRGDRRVGRVPRRLRRPAGRAAADRARAPAQPRAAQDRHRGARRADRDRRGAHRQRRGRRLREARRRDLDGARAYDDDEVIEPGTRVHVLEIRGATALVSE